MDIALEPLMTRSRNQWRTDATSATPSNNQSADEGIEYRGWTSRVRHGSGRLHSNELCGGEVEMARNELFTKCRPEHRRETR